jgi:serine protease SohB
LIISSSDDAALISIVKQFFAECSLEFLSQYGLFLAKSVTVVVAILFVVAGLAALSSRQKREQEGHIEVEPLNKKYEDMAETIKSEILTHDELKKEHKAAKKKEKLERKQAKKEPEAERRKRLYVINFDGDVKASEVENLREEITAVLTMADAKDEVVIKLESPGGMVHTYGLASSQLQRIVRKDIPLTICVDAVAASGGYMMACIGTKILAAPFAILGSIGVMAELPNFHRLLKKHDVDYELFTAGEYKRTVTMFGQNTEKGRDKFNQELEDTHELFKQFVGEHRPQVTIGDVATGEVWYGTRALENKLIDDIQTSDEYLLEQSKECDLYEIKYSHKKGWQEKFGMAAERGVSRAVTKLLTQLQLSRYF